MDKFSEFDHFFQNDEKKSQRGVKSVSSRAKLMRE